MSGWIGVDLDGTLAFYDKWEGPEHIGSPIKVMVDRVKGWLAEGKEVRIFTARVSDPAEELVARKAIATWSLNVFGQVLKVTCSKDYGMVMLYDDRCTQVIHNTGQIVRAPD